MPMAEAASGGGKRAWESIGEHFTPDVEARAKKNDDRGIGSSPATGLPAVGEQVLSGGGGGGGGVLFRPFRAVSCGHPSTAQRWRCGPVPATYYLVPGRRLMRCMEHAGKRNKTQRKTTAKPATDPSIWPMAPPHATAPSPRPRRRRPNLSSLTTAVRLVFKRDLFRALLRFFFVAFVVSFVLFF